MRSNEAGQLTASSFAHHRIWLSIAQFLEGNEFVTGQNEKWEVLETLWVPSGLSDLLHVFVVELGSREKF